MALIEELYRLQEKHGYLRPADLRALAERLQVPLYRLQGLASFYPHFRHQAPAGTEIAVCRDVSCHLNGAEAFTATLQEELQEPCAAGQVAVKPVSCLGRCDNAPAACVNERPVAASLPPDPVERARALAASVRAGTPAAAEPETSRQWHIDPYTDGQPAYGFLRSLPAAAGTGNGGRLDDEHADRILKTLEDAGLRGMGGAGFPTATKWRLVRGQTATPRYVVVNADESEPGTFKDRVILAELPHLVIEGACIAARVVGADKVIIYIRHEYEPEKERLAEAIRSAREAGDLPVEVSIFVSPGGYILGEETALLEALEDRRGEPRNKPPFPVSHGLFGKPTVINNVETLALVPAILSRGADWWRSQGRNGDHGLKFIAISGHVERPGVHEIPLGMPLSELIQAAGGVRGGRALAAVAPGGASSAFLPPGAVDTPLAFQAMQEAGSMLGSGAVVVMAEGTDLVAAATNVVRFFRNESCGKCVPCRVGTEKAVHLLTDLQDGRGDGTLTHLLPQLGETLRLTSICGLGQVALTPILSVLEHFPTDVARLLPRQGD